MNTCITNLLGIMKTRCVKLICFSCLVCLAVWAVVPSGSAQSRPTLGLQFSAGQATLSITGKTGTVYSIQYSGDLSPTNRWTHRTLLQVQGTNDGHLFSGRYKHVQKGVIRALINRKTVVHPGFFFRFYDGLKSL